MNDVTISQAGKYYAQISVLSAADVQAATTSASQSYGHLSWLFSPWLVYGSVGILFLIFIIAMLIQIAHRSANLKNSLLSLLVAFMVASIPLSLKSLVQYTAVKIQASPDTQPRNIIIEQNNSSSITISWETQVEKLGSIKYGKAPLNDQENWLVISNSGKKSTHHQVILTKLTTGVDYEALILSGDKWYDNKGLPIKFRVL